VEPTCPILEGVSIFVGEASSSLPLAESFALPHDLLPASKKIHSQDFNSISAATTQPLSSTSPVEEAAIIYREMDGNFIGGELDQPMDYDGGEHIFMELDDVNKSTTSYDSTRKRKI